MNEIVRFWCLPSPGVPLSGSLSLSLSIGLSVSGHAWAGQDVTSVRRMASQPRGLTHDQDLRYVKMKMKNWIRIQQNQQKKYFEFLYINLIVVQSFCDQWQLLNTKSSVLHPLFLSLYHSTYQFIQCRASIDDCSLSFLSLYFFSLLFLYMLSLHRGGRRLLKERKTEYSS